MAFWDKWHARQGDQPMEWSAQVNEEVLSRFTSVLDELPAPPSGQPLSLCELGCGSSALAVQLRDLGHRVVGVDFSSEVIAANRLRHPEVTWECADALTLGDTFGEGQFDAILGKTLLDCFMARRDAARSLRQLCVQCHRVLKPHGRAVFLDRRSAYHIIGRGRIERLPLVRDAPPFAFHILKVVPGGATSGAEEGLASTERPKQQQWELDLPAFKGEQLVTRTSSGSGVLVVWTVDDVAAATGLRSGDQLVAFDNGRGMQLGKSREMLRALKKGAVKVLVERTEVGGSEDQEAIEGAVAETKASPARRAKAAIARRSSSQVEHLRRLQRARSEQRSSAALPALKMKPDLHISEHVYAAERLFS